MVMSSGNSAAACIFRSLAGVCRAFSMRGAPSPGLVASRLRPQCLKWWSRGRKGALAAESHRKSTEPVHLPVSEMRALPRGRQSLNWLYLTGLRHAGAGGSGAGMAREVIMAVPTPASSLPRGHARCAIFTDRGANFGFVSRWNISG